MKKKSLEADTKMTESSISWQKFKAAMLKKH